MFSSVIVGVDGSAGGRDAIALATCLLGRGGELALAHVHPGRTSPRGSLTLALETAGRTSSLELLESERIAAGIRATLLTIGSRSVGRGLHQLAQQGSCDLVVVGSCSRGFFERATGGDNTRAVLNCSGWAVAVAPAGYAEHPPALREIGVAFDGSPESEQALTLAGSVAADHDARVSAFEALETHPNPFTGGGTSFAEAVDLIISGARRRIEAHPDVEAHVTLGPAVGELSLFSASVDLLVTGSRGHGPLGRLIHASTSKELARSAICPLLVLPHTPFLAVSPETAVGRVDGVDLEGGATVFTIGSEVSCVDGPCGELRRVVIDPVRRELTHLVVEAPHRAGSGHLVPIGLVDATAGAVALRCTRAELAVLEEAQETRFLPGASAKWGYRQNQMLSWPYYGLGLGGPEGLGMAGPQALMFDRVPPGEVEVRRGDSVYATDGPIGRVQGLVIDPADHQVTHVLLDHGHLWGHKRVAIPISAVSSAADGVRVDLARDGVRGLPTVDLEITGRAEKDLTEAELAGNLAGDASTQWPHSRADAEARAIVAALRRDGVLTLAGLRAACWADHWSDDGFAAALHDAIAGRAVTRVGDDRYELTPTDAAASGSVNAAL